MCYNKSMELKITAQDLEDWEGTWDAFLEGNPQLPELVERRIGGLRLGEEIRVKFGADADKFNIRRTA